MMGERGRSIKEISLIEFQQWITAKIPTEIEEELFRKTWDVNDNTLKKRKRIAKRKLSKADYEEYLRTMREMHKNNRKERDT